MLRRELANLCRVRLLPRGGPFPPVSPHALIEHVTLQRLMTTMQLQGFATLGPELLEILLQIRRQFCQPAMEVAQQGKTQRGGGRPVDQIQLLELGGLFLQTALAQSLGHLGFAQQGSRIGMENVVVVAAGRGVGAVLVRQAAEHRMQGADCQCIGAQRGGAANKLLQCAQIAQPPIVLPAQRIDLGGNPPDMPLAGEFGHRGTARWCAGQGPLLLAAAQLMITAGLRGEPPVAVDPRLVPAAVFTLNRAVAAGGQPPPQIDGLIGIGDQQRA